MVDAHCLCKDSALLVTTGVYLPVTSCHLQQVKQQLLTCTTVNAVGSGAMPGNVAVIIKVVSKVWGIAQLLCCTGAAHRGIEGPLPYQVTILCTAHVRL